MNRRALWVSLLDAAQDQPNPTRPLRMIVQELLKRDPVALDTPDSPPPPAPKMDAVDERMIELAARRERKPRAAERCLTALAQIQSEDDDDGA